MENQNQNRNGITPKQNTYGGKAGDAGTQQTYSFHLRDATDDDVAQVENAVTRLIEEHNSPQKILYTTLTGRTDDGRPFAEVMLLPVRDTLRLTIGAGLESALGTSFIEMRRLAIYMLSAYLAVAYDLDMDEVQQLCDLADEQAEREEAEEAEEAESNQSPC